MPPDTAPVHASAVAIGPRGVLILGRSGSGKSTLALQILAHGGQLIADDRVCLARRGGRLLAWAPPSILGQIEARGIGILGAEVAPPTPIALAVDLDRSEPERLPPHRTWGACDIPIPLIHGAGHPHLVSGIIQFLKGGRTDLP